MRQRKGAHWTLVEKLEEKATLGRSSCRWEDKIKTHLQVVIRGHEVDLSGSE
jgi:hypothetical protein